MSSNKEKTAIILVNYNGLTDSIDCIESLYKIDNFDEVKIIFVDNASKNDDGKVIKEKYTEVKVINSRVNRGFSVGNNLGITYALKEHFGYIVLLNNDTVVDSLMIEKLKECCTENSVVTPKMYYYSNRNVIWYGGGRINRFTGNAQHYQMGCEDTHISEIKDCSFATGCCIMIKSNTIEKIGLLNEDYFMYCEDTEFCIRLKLNGYNIQYVPDAKLWHKVSSSTGGSDSPFSTYYMTRNRLHYVKRYRKYFACTAYAFSLVSRYIRMLQCKDENRKSAFKQGILDHFNGITGEVKAWRECYK
jgi:GT2 family glycosyltransferase